MYENVARLLYQYVSIDCNAFRLVEIIRFPSLISKSKKRICVFLRARERERERKSSLILHKLYTPAIYKQHLFVDTEKYLMFLFVVFAKRIFRTVIYIRRMHTRGTSERATTASDSDNGRCKINKPTFLG